MDLKDDVVRARYHERRLQEFENSRLHPEIAAAAALEFCDQEGISAPPWLVKRAAPLLCGLLKSQKPDGPGRNGTFVSQFRQHLVHLERWFAVLAIRDIRTRVRRDAAVVREMKSRFQANAGAKVRKHLTRRERWLGQGTYPCASKYLSGSEAYGSPDTVEHSYKLIRLANRKGEESQSCVFELDFLKKIGALPSDGDSGKKLLHLFDLEP